jgi:hypothetical protein
MVHLSPKEAKVPAHAMRTNICVVRVIDVLMEAVIRSQTPGIFDFKFATVQVTV